MACVCSESSPVTAVFPKHACCMMCHTLSDLLITPSEGKQHFREQAFADAQWFNVCQNTGCY